MEGYTVKQNKPNGNKYQMISLIYSVYETKQNNILCQTSPKSLVLDHKTEITKNLG